MHPFGVNAARRKRLPRFLDLEQHQVNAEHLPSMERVGDWGRSHRVGKRPALYTARVRVYPEVPPTS
jgi:hypothetical protein